MSRKLLDIASAGVVPKIFKFSPFAFVEPPEHNKVLEFFGIVIVLAKIIFLLSLLLLRRLLPRLALWVCLSCLLG